MASIIKANQLQDFGGNSIITSDGAGNLTTQKINYPAFFAHKNAVQNVTSNTYTKITFETEKFDTDNAFSNSKFTVPSGKAGKYFFSTELFADSDGNSHLEYTNLNWYLNGSAYTNHTADFRGNNAKHYSLTSSILFDLSVSDYIEVYARISDSSGTPYFEGGYSEIQCFFQGYRIGS